MNILVRGDRAVAQGLSRIHGEHIVHVDIKPENILVTRDWVLKVGDLGLAYDLTGSRRGRCRGRQPLHGPRAAGRPADMCRRHI